MEEKKYTVILEDGKRLTNLRMNGNNYITSEKISKSIFENNCSSITVDDGESTMEFTNMELVHVTEMPDGYWFAFRELSKDEIAFRELRSDIAFIAMMSEIDL